LNKAVLGDSVLQTTAQRQRDRGAEDDPYDAGAVRLKAFGFSASAGLAVA